MEDLAPSTLGGGAAIICLLYGFHKAKAKALARKTREGFPKLWRRWGRLDKRRSGLPGTDTLGPQITRSSLWRDHR